MNKTARLLAIPLLLAATGCTSSTVAQEGRLEKSATRSTRLYVRTLPPGASIRIDGQARGTSDRLFTIPADATKVLIEVELDGRAEQKDVVIRGGQITRVEFDLRNTSRSAPAAPPAPTAPVSAGLVAQSPPVVVATCPVSGDTRVEPATGEIRVTFSKDMLDGIWSWSQISDETFPEMTGRPRYLADGRTCVLPVRLQPGRTYAFLLNSAKFQNFMDAGHRPAVPYLLIFETRE